MNQIELTEEKETLLITLLAKARDYRSSHSLLRDKKAYDIVQSVNVDFSKYEGYGNSATVVRAKEFDGWVKTFIEKYPHAVIVYLGCGLDSRITRMNIPGSVRWFDVDYPEVIEIRRNFYADTDNYKMLSSSVIQTEWLSHIPKDRPTFILAEGLFEYLTKDQVSLLLQRLSNHFTQGEIAFDVMSSFAIQSGKEKLKATTGAVHQWSVDDPVEVDRLVPGMKRLQVLPVFSSGYTKKLSFKERVFFMFLSLFAKTRNMLIMLRYQLAK